MKQKMKLPSTITIPEGTPLEKAPVKIAFCEQTYEYLIPIGENEFATLIIGEAAINALKEL
jgi:hypothetical protein